MSDSNTIKQLRKEVQLLRDELAIMKRKYEDIIYNLDDDNFSSRFVKEKGEMRTAIEVNAEGIKTKVSNEKFESEIKQTASSIDTKVSAINDEFKKYSTTTQTEALISSKVEEINTSVEDVETRLSTQIEQTNNQISLTATEAKEYAEDYVTNTLTGYATKADLQLTTDGITSTVSELSGDVDALNSYASGLSDDISGLSGSVSSIRQTATEISLKVDDLETFKTSTFTQTADGFTLDGEKTTFTGVVFLTDNSGNKRVGLFHDESQNFAQVILRKYSQDYCPLVIEFDDDDVYIGDRADGNEVATRSWVLENAGSGGTGGYAVFG